MKKSILMVVVCLLSVVASAQTTSATKLKISLHDGQVVTYNLSDIDSLWFVRPVPEKQTVYEVNVPEEFSDSYVYNILDADGLKIGEVCQEYIRNYEHQVEGRHVVVYSATECFDASAGAYIVWDAENDSIATYTSLDLPFELLTVYIDTEGHLLTEAPVGAEVSKASLSAYIINDVRDTEKNTYKIVKIGTQYWMAENLRATKYTDGTDLKQHTNSDLSGWRSETAGAYTIPFDDSESLSTMGVMYNGVAMTNVNISPTGWKVPEQSDFDTMKSYLKTSSGAKLKYDGGWFDGGDSYPCTNLTSFCGQSDGYFFAASDYGYYGSGTDVYYWTTTAAEKNYIAARLNYKSNSLYIYSGGHSGSDYGHYIRCLLKR